MAPMVSVSPKAAVAMSVATSRLQQHQDGEMCRWQGPGGAEVQAVGEARHDQAEVEEREPPDRGARHPGSPGR
jgi:hypothetical protein